MSIQINILHLPDSSVINIPALQQVLCLEYFLGLPLAGVLVLLGMGTYIVKGFNTDVFQISLRMSRGFKTRPQCSSRLCPIPGSLLYANRQ